MGEGGVQSRKNDWDFCCISGIKLKKKQSEKNKKDKINEMLKHL